MSKETYMIECLTRDLTTRLMEEKNVTMKEALDIVYTSKTFHDLNNLETGLYFQGSVYLYDLLECELSCTKQSESYGISNT